MKYSIVVPIYNIEKYLKPCIDSLLKQEFRDYEIILVDDGSTDSSPKLCDQYARDNINIRVVHKINGGLVSARKAGALAAIGEYIVPVDGDDYVDKTYLSSINQIILKHEVDAIVFGYIEDKDGHFYYNKCLYDEGVYRNNELQQLKDAFIYNRRQSGLNVGILPYTAWTKVVKRDIYIRCQMKVDDRMKLGEDVLLTAYLLEEVKSVYLSKNRYYYYRIVESSMMHRFDTKSVAHFESLLIELRKISYINQNTIGVYSFRMLEDQINRMLANSKNYTVFKSNVRETFKYENFWDSATNFSCHGLSLKQMVKKYFLKHRMLAIIYCLSKNAESKF